MKIVFPKLSLSFFAVLVLALSASNAWADIVVQTGANNQGTATVAINSATDVLTVTGDVRSAPYVVNFTSSSGSGLLSTAGRTVVGGVGNVPFTQITFWKSNNDTFTRGVFNLNAATNGSVLIHVEGINITGGFFEDDFLVDSHGQNSFTVDAINGQAMTSISLTAINGAVFESMGRLRIN